MTVIERKPPTCGRDSCRVSACFCCSPPVPWEHDERNPAAHDDEPVAAQQTGEPR